MSINTIKSLIIKGIIIIVSAGLIATLSPVKAQDSRVSTHKWFGVNRSGAEFSPQTIPGKEGIDYAYPTEVEAFTHFSAKGLRLVRIPILWERMQPKANGPLEVKHVSRLAAVFEVAKQTDTKVIIDLHNYGRYYGKPLESKDAAALSDLWLKILNSFGDDPALFGIELMNEPHDLPGGSKAWQSIVQEVVTSIRKVDTKITILIPGYSWQSARFWQDNNKDLLIRDPAGNVLYAAHQYFDASFTGTYTTKTQGEPSRGSELIEPFVEWLKKNKIQGIITEYGAPYNDTTALAQMSHMLETVDSTSELVGAVYWASGPRWGNYPLSVEPTSESKERAITSILYKYPTRLKQVKLPRNINPSNIVKLKNTQTLFLVNSDGLYPFATQEGYETYRKLYPKSRLYTVPQTMDQFTIRWREVEADMPVRVVR